MAYNLISRLTSEGSSVAPMSEGMNLSPVEFAVPMSEQTRTTAGHGSDILGPVIIEGSPEAPHCHTSADHQPNRQRYCSWTRCQSGSRGRHGRRNRRTDRDTKHHYSSHTGYVPSRRQHTSSQQRLQRWRCWPGTASLRAGGGPGNGLFARYFTLLKWNRQSLNF